MDKAEELAKKIEEYKAKLAELQEDLQNIGDDNRCHGNEYRLSILNHLDNWAVSVLDLGRDAHNYSVFEYRDEQKKY
ncbi:MAG: hypothetical protein IJ181_10660 [Acidaminococcaceae bacterium]|nr:hypothetical protein [Acidaminococcaceae bacterium]